MLGSTIKILLRRILSKTRRSQKFPAWPVENSLVEYIQFIADALVKVSREGMIQYIQFWPKGYKFAATLTHDVESEYGLGNIERLLEVEDAESVKSAINLVPKEYSFKKDLVNQFKDRGFEVGIHGWSHDGRLFSNKKIFDERAEKINQKIKEWGAKGFRSPVLYRNPEWLEHLDVEYDSSFPDTDQYTPQTGGCCSILPYFIRDILELPLTLPQDYTLYNVLGLSVEEAFEYWKNKIEFIEGENGLAVLLTHPDKHYTDSPEKIECYRNIIILLKKKKCWIAQPKEICYWWKERAKAFIEVEDGISYIKNGLEGMEVKRLE